MRRREFLSLFLLAPTTLLAEDGLLIDQPTTSNGMLVDAPGSDASGWLIDIPKDVIETQTPKLVHLYSPKTWSCPHCVTAEKELRGHLGIRLIVHKQDELPEFFSGQGFPVLHWGSGKQWQSGWTNKEQFLAKLLDDNSSPPAKKPAMAVKDSGGSHWSVEGDWSPSRQKAINHLVNVHGYQRDRIESLNIGQLLTLHDAAHEGRRVTTKASSCPTGTCPTQSRQQSQTRGSFLFFHW